MRPHIVLAAFALTLLGSGCDLTIRDDALRPALTAHLADPVVLGRLCKAAPESLGQVSPSQLTLGSITARSPMLSSQGSGQARITYAPLSGKPPRCEATASFNFDDGGGTRVNAGTFAIRSVTFDFGTPPNPGSP